MALLLRDPFWTSRWTARRTDAVLAIVVIGFLTLLLVSVFRSPRPYVREGARRTACRNCLRQISIACNMYADENRGRFPGSLQQLYPAFTDNPRIFSCASSPSDYGDFAKGKVTERSSSYVLVPGLRSGMPAEFILAYDQSPENHQGNGRNVLHLDGSVEWLKMSPGSPEEAVFQKRLAEQTEKVKAWKPPAPAAGGTKPEGQP
ncbi:MAG TPA: DUF1559 domain-containing protein [Planctomycetota bacterium]|nr:DUF1559 domain-containing protein [Planctomycetota bacterium]